MHFVFNMYGGNMGTPRKHKLGTSAGYLARPKLGALKNIYTGSKYLNKNFNTYGMDKKKKVKKPTSKLEYYKKPDNVDIAYNEAVSRLRIFLEESYTPMKRQIRELDSAGEETDNLSVISGVSRTSKYPHYHYNSYTKKFPSYNPRGISHADDKQDENKFDGALAPPELTSFIERQENYIEQLERESTFCREELSTLLNKVKEVISENESLHEKQKNNLMKSVFNQFETETETEPDLDLSTLKPSKKYRKERVMEGPSIVFESRISELEAQLTQAKIELKKAQEESKNPKNTGECYSDACNSLKKQIENLQMDKTKLQETVSKLQAALNVLRDKEYSTTDQVKRSLDVAEQAQYEKTAAEHEIRRLKDELERQHGKLRDAVNEQSRRVADERSAVERRYTQQIEQLTAELGVYWEQSSKFQLELDKQRRENSDLRRELAQKQAQIDELKKEMQNKITTLQSDIGVSGAEKSALEQQICTLQMANERNERHAKQEVAGLQVEMQSLRQRLDRADADLIHSRRENIRLSEQVATLEKEINMNAALSDERNKRPEAIALPQPKSDSSKALDSIVKDIENKHAATVAELEGMIQSQNQLMDKLSSECHILTQKLEESSNRHKEEIRELQTNVDFLNNKFKESQIKSSNNTDESNRNRQHEFPSNSPKKESAPNINRTNVTTKPNPPQIENQKQQAPGDTNFQIVSDKYQNQQQNVTDQAQNPSHKDDENVLKKNVDKVEEIPHQFNVNQGGVKQEEFDSNQQEFDPNQREFNSSEPEYNQNKQQFNSDQQEFDQNQQQEFDPNQQQEFDPNQQQEFDPNQQSYDPSQAYDPNQTETNQNLQQYDMSQQEYDPNQQSYDPNQQTYDPNQQYDPDQQQYDPNQQEYDPNQESYDPNQQSYDPNQEYANQEYDPNAHYDPNAQYMEENSYPEEMETPKEDTNQLAGQ